VFVRQNKDVVIKDSYKGRLSMTLIQGILLSLINAAFCLFLPKLLSLALSPRNSGETKSQYHLE
jgi:hypothetical protein